MTISKMLAVFSVLGFTGCSFCFVRGPTTQPATREQPEIVEPDNCVSGKAAPVVDTVIAGYQVLRTAVAASADDSAYSGQPIDRSTDIAAGVSLAALFLGSAIYGYVTTSSCARAKQQAADLQLQRDVERDEQRRMLPRSAPPPGMPVAPVSPQPFTGAPGAASPGAPAAQPAPSSLPPAPAPAVPSSAPPAPSQIAPPPPGAPTVPAPAPPSRAQPPAPSSRAQPPAAAFPAAP